MIFFEPNLTAWIQPLDAGIIRCLKAHYRGEQCARALDLDEAGEADIWEMNQLESMLMCKAAWRAVSSATIANCWRHTAILPPKGSVGLVSEPEALAAAWEVVVRFASTDMTLPGAEDILKSQLGSQYSAKQWEGPLKAVMDAEGDLTKALTSITQLRASSTISLHESTSPPLSALPLVPPTKQIQEAEQVLMLRVQKLKDRNRLWGDLPSLDDILVPNGENEAGEDDEPVELLSDEQIIERVRKDLAGNKEEEDEEDEEVEEKAGKEAGLSITEMLTMACQLERGCIGMECESALTLAQTLRRF
jgi:hypothetical protein